MLLTIGNTFGVAHFQNGGPSVCWHEELCSHLIKWNEISKWLEPCHRQIWNIALSALSSFYGIESQGGTKDALGLSLYRSAIEEHEQDRSNRGCIDFAIDLARESGLLYMKENPYIIQDCLRSENGLLVRLGFYLFGKSDVNPDEKVSTIISFDILSVFYYKHEVFNLLADAYPMASSAVKERFCLYADNCYTKSLEDDRSEYYPRFNLYSFLLRYDPKDPYLTSRITEIRMKYPNISPLDFPDLNLYVSSGGVPEPMPLKPNQLEYGQLRNYVSHEMDGGNRYPVFDQLMTAAEQYPEKTVELLVECINHKDALNTIILEHMLSGLSWGSLTDNANEVAEELLFPLLESSAHFVQALKGLSGLTDAVDDSDIDFWLNVVPKLDETWQKVESFESSEFTADGDLNFIQFVISHPVDAWVGILSGCLTFIWSKADLLSHPESAQATRLLDAALENFLAGVSSSPNIAASAAMRINSIGRYSIDWVKGAATKVALAGDVIQQAFWQGVLFAGALNSEAWSALKDVFRRLLSSGYSFGAGNRKRAIYAWLTSQFINGAVFDECLVEELRCVAYSPEDASDILVPLFDRLSSLGEQQRLLGWDGCAEPLSRALAKKSEEYKAAVEVALFRLIEDDIVLRDWAVKLVTELGVPGCDAAALPYSAECIGHQVDWALPDEFIAIAIVFDCRQGFSSLTKEDLAKALSKMRRSDLSNEAINQLKDALASRGDDELLDKLKNE